MNVSPTLKCFIGNNFVVDGYESISLDSPIVRSSDTYLDERSMFLSFSINLSNWDWYFNYLDFIKNCALKRPDARPSYMLDLGYIPVIYLPSCLSHLENDLIRVLDVKGVPYVKQRKMSFSHSKVDLEGYDVWVSKLDAATYLNCEPEDVTSKAFIRRVLLNV